ncbi:putative ATPase [Brevibacterium sanguinis]|uniref:ATPase n=2 Tax=Brevibacterium TaxID=1696 RepID=A0ABX9GLV1_9MICO|nr:MULTISPECIES: AAA family ATPase [Brevibacterium]RBP62530.1 putative ATPase [Brevibacterium sanguinis]RBP69194.1 putative ATPase [Brevibacterium celere]
MDSPRHSDRPTWGLPEQPAWGLPLRSVTRHAHAPPSLSPWLQSLPMVDDILRGFDFAPTTIFVGENGSGKSTLIEALAEALGLPRGGGSAWEVRDHVEDPPELSEHLQIVRGAAAPRGGFFLRAETMHENMAYLLGVGAPRAHAYASQSHGEMFIEMLSADFLDHGLWILDEPESALSFTTSLSLLQLIRERERTGRQTIMATHSPVLASAEGAKLVEVGEWGLREEEWERLDMVDHWRRFLTDPRRYTRYFD